MIMRAALIGLLLAAAAPAFHYERSVRLAAGNAPETCVALPSDLLSHAAPWLQDLRVMANGRDVAYMVRTSNDGASVVARPARILNLGRRNGEISFDVEVMEPVYQRVVLHVNRSRFSVLVRIRGMQRLGDTGVSLGEFAYSSNAENDVVQQREITLPESSFRYLHFDIRTAALEPLSPRDIAGVDVTTPAAEPARYAAVAAAGAPQQKPHATVYEFAVPAKVPVDRLTFASDRDDAVFSRTADLERYRPDAANKARREMPVQSEGISLVQLPVRAHDAKPPTKPAIALALGAVPYASTVRLTIQNGDDAPLALHDVALEMRRREVCFLRRPNTSYVLRYGDPKLGPAQYDMLPLTEADKDASESMLGAEHALTPEEAAALLPFTERHPVLLWIALVLVVATLGIVALRSARS
jgi:hypothetical protein